MVTASKCRVLRRHTAIVDGILSGTGDPLTYEANGFTLAMSRRRRVNPAAPFRPTIITGGQSPTEPRVSAERADV